MATSMPKGQSAISCELCELDQKIKWICIQCKAKMCGKCEKVHHKIKSSSDHKIMDIKDVSIDNLPTLMPDFTKMKCPAHPEQYCCLFCSKCDTLVCPVCVANTHKKHKLKTISEEYETKLANSERFKAELEQKEKYLKDLQIELRKIHAIQRQSCSKTEKDILHQEEALLNAVREHSKKFLNEVQTKHEGNLRKIEEKKEEIENMMENIQKKRSYVDNLLHLDGPVNIFTEKNPFSLPTAPKLDIGRTELAVAFELVPGDEKTVFGRLQDHVSTDVTSPKILNEFSTEFPACHDILSTSDGIIWINNWQRKRLLKAKIESKTLKVLAEFNMEVKPSLYNNGDLLIALLFGSVLKTLKADKGGEHVIETLYDISPKELTAVHVEQNESRILIGAGLDKKEGSHYIESQLIVLDKKGNKEKIFQHNGEGCPLFTCIKSIACTSHGTIGAINIINLESFKGKVMILDMHGRVNEYYGKSTNFKPTRITASPWNNFIITEVSKHFLHILDEEGSFITLINTKELGIELPYSLSFTDHLFIGCGGYVGQEKGAQIYELDNFPW